MNRQTVLNMKVAVELLKTAGHVTLTYRSGRTETITTANWKDEAPDIVEGSFVESVICNDPITDIR